MRKENFDGLDLVDTSAYLPAGEVDQYIVNQIDAAAAASTGWGCSYPQRIFLSIARALRDALGEAEKADELARKLKGEQLSHGRTKKQLEKLTADCDRLRAERDAAADALGAAQDAGAYEDDDVSASDDS